MGMNRNVCIKTIHLVSFPEQTIFETGLPGFLLNLHVPQDLRFLQGELHLGLHD